MTLPPERISIKRRRGDEPIETLILERDRKRRFTDYFFQRLPNEQIDLAPKSKQEVQKDSQDEEDALRARLGIPKVKSTVPGDEIKDLSNYRATQKRQLLESSLTAPRYASDSSLKESSLDTSDTRVPNTRRFHLTRDLSSALKPHAGGIRKLKSLIRPPLPTFVERQQINDETNSVVADRLVHFRGETSPDADVANSRNLTKTQIQTFQPSSKKGSVRTGTSIRDDPRTWDLQSDQLADELAALAMEMDPSIRPDPALQSEVPENKTMSLSDDFIYETYIRMQLNASGPSLLRNPADGIGYLVIDEDEADLWEQYLRDEDDDDEWDEEDEDSNAEDNPRNDYPEDEVSSDDEFGRSVYRHRRNASDNEEFGDDLD